MSKRKGIQGNDGFRKMDKPYKRGLFNYDTLEVQFGGPMTNPAFVFTATAIKVPTWDYHTWEREDAGGGWYGSGRERVDRKADRVFIIVRGNVVIGVMYSPYYHGIRTELRPIDEKSPKEVRDFFATLNLPYEFYISNKKKPTEDTLADDLESGGAG